MFTAVDNIFRECKFYQVVQCGRWNNNEVHSTAFRRQGNNHKNLTVFIFNLVLYKVSIDLLLSIQTL